MLRTTISRYLTAALALSFLFLALPASAAITATSTPSALSQDGYVIDALMTTQKQYQEYITKGDASKEASDTDPIGKQIGWTPEYMTKGIGAGFLSSIIGPQMYSKATGAKIQASPNPAFQGILKFGTILGVAFTTLFLLAHSVAMFFNKLEYGDLLGEAKERFIGGFRSVLAFVLVLPMTTGGLAGAQYVVSYVAAGSNGIGNKSAELAVKGGFGSDPLSLTSMNFSHDFDQSASAEVFAQMAGQQACIAYYKSIGTNAAEVGRICAATLGGSGSGSIDVAFDPESVTEESDKSYCQGINYDSVFKNSAYTRTTCVRVRQIQREAYARMQQVFEKYDGDIESPEAIDDLKKVAAEMQSGIRKQIASINASICEGGFDANDVCESYQSSGSDNTVLASTFLNFIDVAGWPGLGLIYADIGAQIDAINGIQSSNGTQSRRFSPDLLQGVGNQKSAAMSRVGTSSAIGRAVANDTGISEAKVSDPGPGSVSRRIGEWFGSVFGTIGDGVDLGAAKFNEASQWVTKFIFSPIFSDPGPVATQKIGSDVLGTLMLAAGVYDASKFFSESPAGDSLGNGGSSGGDGVGKAAFASFIKNQLDKVKSGSLGEGDNYLIVDALSIFFSVLLLFIMLLATFMVFILPKLPIFLVAFLALEWAIWAAIIIFGSPLWVALNFSSVTNQPGLFAQRALSGLGVLAYLALFPVLVVAGVVISAIAYNLIVPVLGTLLLVSYRGGIVESLLGAFALPAVVLLGLCVGAFVSITAISRIPTMITNFLGISAPGSSVSESINSFIASPASFHNMQNPQQIMQGAGNFMGKGAK